MSNELNPDSTPASAITSEERTWAVVAHLGGIVVSFLAPLVVYLTKGKESAFVSEHSKEALNFQITYCIAMLASTVLVVIIIGVLFLIAVPIAMFVLSIVAAVKASGNESYRYPFTLRLVK